MLLSRLALAVAAGVLAFAAPALAAPHALPNLGPNVVVFDPSMPQAQIQSTLDSIAAQQVPNQFGTQRYAVYFLPGTYGSATQPLNFQVGYYTEVAGLGARPGDVTIHGTADVYNQCFGPNDCTALNNFWRSLSNLTIAVAGKGGCQFGEFWAASQASPMRRVHVDGQITLMDYCTSPSFASGGFIADSQFTGGVVINGSQQQYLVRNSDVDLWTNGVWNQVFAGVVGAPPQSFPNPPYTTLPTNPVSREKPFPTVDGVYVPAVQHDAAGTTWAAAQTPGRLLPWSSFFVAKPGMNAAAMNAALARGKNLLFTPGVYDVDRTIRVERPDTVVLGIGMATLTAQDGTIPMTVADVKGVEISGLIFDAGPHTSPALLVVGNALGGHSSDPSDPVALHDVFFRIGGPHVGKALTSLVVGRDGTILDDVWAWRADHGSGVGWTVNTASTGVVVTGDDVVATGLFVEHYQRWNVFWAGERGRTIMFQNELPYDPPNQAAWGSSGGGTLGWAAYKVAPWVQQHEAWGLGVYCFFNVDPTIHASRAIEVPTGPGIHLHDILDLSISSSGTIDHVVNDFGPPTQPGTVPNDVVAYP